MKKLSGSLWTFILCACLTGDAHAVVFRAVATDLSGKYSAGSIRFGHASANQEKAWSTMATDYAAVAAVPFFTDRRDSIYLTTTPHWTFYVDIWTSGWSHGDVLLKIWVEDASWPGQGWWAVYLQNPPGADGGFVATEPGSAIYPQYSAIIPSQVAAQGVRVLLTQNPEPSCIAALLTGLAGLAALHLRRRVRS